MVIRRILQFNLPKKQSAFLWGPRKTGKTTYLKGHFPKSLVYDFLQTDKYLEFSKRPALLREELLTKSPDILKKPIILDEVQKIPKILDEVHGLIENHSLQFILCGSSARKLKRGQANLLGGRAWRYELFPLVYPEIKNFKLLRALNHGLIPGHYLEENAKKSLLSYTQDYLKEEVFEEGLVRNIPAFSRFFDAMRYCHGEMINYSNVARDCSIDSKTVKDYFQILSDTLLATLLEPFKIRQNRQVISKAPKFYLFDVGVAGILTSRHLDEERGEAFGKAFEHFIFMELKAYRSYRDLNFPIHYWRTKTGAEVDFILGKAEVAIEVKGSGKTSSSDLKALSIFRDEFSPRQAILVCNEKSERVVNKIRILPWRIFLEELWQGKILK